MEAMNQYDEKLLSLSLAINNIADHDNHDDIIHRERKRILFTSSTITNNNPIISLSYDHESFESKIFTLLRMREQMLKQNHHHQGNTTTSGLHLIHLLLTAASADLSAAPEKLIHLYRGGASPIGDSVQRVAAYFADGLAARLLKRIQSPFFGAVAAAAGPTDAEEFSAFVALYRASPFFQFAHFTANQAIAEALELHAPPSKSSSLHVVDFDVSYGFQWPSLIQSLGGDDHRAESLRITGLGRSPKELRETENRLRSFSRGFRNLSFDFHGLLLNNINDNNLDYYTNCLKRRDNNETLAVNLVLHRNDMSETLKLVKSLNPTVVVLVEKELSPSSSSSSSSSSFIARFVDSLQYFAAMFDSLDDSLPAESSERLSIEKNYLGSQIIKSLMLNCHEEEEDGCNIVNDKRVLMQSHGFKRVKISSKSVIQAKLLLKMRANNGGHSGFRVCERDEGMALSLGWQDRYLLTASVWHLIHS